MLCSMLRFHASLFVFVCAMLAFYLILLQQMHDHLSLADAGRWSATPFYHFAT